MAEMSYTQMVQKLKISAKPIHNRYNQEILEKPIPDVSAEGGLDPRVLAVRAKASGETAVLNPSIEERRAAMGWPNLDVTCGKVSTTTRSIAGRNGAIPIRVYQSGEEKKRPCLIFFHGGGFFGGSVNCVENPCKCIALHADAVVISVDYRLAPEYPFPHGFDDNWDVIAWASEHPSELNIDANKIGVCGDSAGGNFAAACTQKDRDEKTDRVKFQALIYPVVNVGALKNEYYTWDLSEYNLTQDSNLALKAVQEIGSDIEFIRNVYLNGNLDNCKNPYVSPLFAPVVSGLPPTFIITAEYDYLRLEAEAYGRKLQKANVPVAMLRYKGTDHAFVDKIGEFPQAEDCMREIATRFRIALTD